MANPNMQEYGVPTRFNGSYQPPAVKKKAGWAKRKRSRELLQAIFEQKFSGEDAKFRRDLATYFDVEPEDITNEMMIMFSQIVKVAKTGDTNAFNALMDRAYGKPKEDITITNKDKPVAVTFEPIQAEDFQILTNEEEGDAAGEPNSELPT